MIPYGPHYSTQGQISIRLGIVLALKNRDSTEKGLAAMDNFFSIDAFSGQTTLVTGGTSGIGRRTAIEFAAHGANVVISGRNQSRGNAVVDEIRSQGGNVELILGEITDSTFCDYLVAQTVERLGSLDILVNNAGIAFHGPIDLMSNDDWHRLLDTNLSSVFFMSRAALRVMKKQRKGSIINIASEAALRGIANTAAYSATKGAIVTMTQVMALDCANEGIRINTICPGDIDTPMMDYAWHDRANSRKAIRDSVKNHVPLAMVGHPCDIAFSAMYLASDAARFVTGASLPIDGGTTAR